MTSHTSGNNELLPLDFKRAKKAVADAEQLAEEQLASGGTPVLDKSTLGAALYLSGLMADRECDAAVFSLGQAG